MPRTSTSSRLSHIHPPRTSTPASESFAKNQLVEDIAIQRQRYFTTFSEHASAVRGNPELPVAYQRVTNGKKALKPNTPWKKLTSEEHLKRQNAMERILARPADSIDDHLLMCFAAHTLLLLQHSVMARLPGRIAREINVRTHQLRSEQRRKNPVPSQEHSRPIVPIATLPDFHRPHNTFICHPIATHVVESFLASPHSLVGHQFMLPDFGFFYRITSAEKTLNGHRFGLQYEDTRCADVVDLSEMEYILQNSNAVEV